MATLNTTNELRAFAMLPPSAQYSDDSVQVFLDMANLVLSDYELTSLDSARQKLIELNLAAHFAIKTVERGGLTQQSVGESEERYQLMSDKLYGLASSNYGQTAMLLDTTGALTKLTAGYVKARFMVV